MATVETAVDTTISRDTPSTQEKGVVRTEVVTKVIDGGNFTTYGNGIVRLNDVHAPEKAQRGYMDATQYLERLVGGKEIIVNIVAIDSYGRSVANVKVGGVSVNLAMRAFLTMKKYSNK